MKKLITAAIVGLASGAASAYDLSVFDNQEFYSGQHNNHAVIINPGIASVRENLFQEGRFPKVTPGLEGAGQPEIADEAFPGALYLEAHWPA